MHILYKFSPHLNIISLKTFGRIILTIFAVFASYFFIYWIPFSLIDVLQGMDWNTKRIVALVPALLIGWGVWKMMGSNKGLGKAILMGGVITGTIFFVLGFVGPMILSDWSMGPMLGFVTGPLGFLLGLIGGGIYWRVKVKTKIIG